MSRGFDKINQSINLLILKLVNIGQFYEYGIIIIRIAGENPAQKIGPELDE